MIRQVLVETGVVLAPFLLAALFLAVRSSLQPRRVCRCGKPATRVAHRHTGQPVWRCPGCHTAAARYVAAGVR